jgi:hypothetical protein
MTEKNYVVNVKTTKGTIVTARGDTAEELIANINALISNGAHESIIDLELMLTGTPQVSPPSNGAIDTVVNALGGTVVNEQAWAGEQKGFAPVPPPTALSAGGRVCGHGPMIARKGNGAKGEWKGYFCPTPKDTPGQCTPQWLTKKDPEWNTV